MRFSLSMTYNLTSYVIQFSRIALGQLPLRLKQNLRKSQIKIFKLFTMSCATDIHCQDCKIHSILKLSLILGKIILLFLILLCMHKQNFHFQSLGYGILLTNTFINSTSHVAGDAQLNRMMKVELWKLSYFKFL